MHGVARQTVALIPWHPARPRTAGPSPPRCRLGFSNCKAECSPSPDGRGLAMGAAVGRAVGLPPALRSLPPAASHVMIKFVRVTSVSSRDATWATESSTSLAPSCQPGAHRQGG